MLDPSPQPVTPLASPLRGPMAQWCYTGGRSTQPCSAVHPRVHRRPPGCMVSMFGQHPGGIKKRCEAPGFLWNPPKTPLFQDSVFPIYSCDWYKPTKSPHSQREGAHLHVTFLARCKAEVEPWVWGAVGQIRQNLKERMDIFPDDQSMVFGPRSKFWGESARPRLTQQNYQVNSAPFHNWPALNMKICQNHSKSKTRTPKRSAILLGKRLGDECPNLGPHPASSRDENPISQATESSAASPPHSPTPSPVAIGSIWQWPICQKIPSSTVPTHRTAEGLWVLQSECTFVWHDWFSLMYASLNCHEEQQFFVRIAS